MKHVMLDIETLSTEANAVICAIGAVWFDPHAKDFEVDAKELAAHNATYPYELFPLCFERRIDIQTCLDVGMAVSAGTLKWWSEQADEPRKQAFSGETGIREALNDFADFINMVSVNWPVEDAGAVQRDDVCVWGNGAMFDLGILSNAYHRLGYRAPWGFRMDRCYRTFVALANDLACATPRKQLGTFHNPLDDAISQAMHMQEINSMVRKYAALQVAA